MSPVFLDTADHYRRECEEYRKKEEVEDSLDTLPVGLKADSIKSNNAAHADQGVRLNHHCHERIIHKLLLKFGKELIEPELSIQTALQTNHNN